MSHKRLHRFITITALLIFVGAVLMLLFSATAHAHIRDVPPIPDSVRQTTNAKATRACRADGVCTYQELQHRRNHLRWTWYYGWSTYAPSAVASWYELYGNRTASGSTLRYGDRTVAHKTMRFGTICRFRYGNRYIWGVVRDRGPYVKGRTFDLEKWLSDRIGMTGAGHASVRHRCV